MIRNNLTLNQNYNMRTFIFLIALLTTSFCSAQMRPIGKVYIVEGIVADRETLQVIPSAILYNDSLGITTTSDENGYFKIVVPHELILERRLINIDIVKSGYKRNGSGFSYNPVKQDTSNSSKSVDEVYNYDVKYFLMASNNSTLSSTGGAHRPAKEDTHGYAVIKLAFEEKVASEQRSRKMEKLKQGNEKVYFIINNQVGLATSSYDMYFDESAPIVFINGKQVKLDDINKLVKRSMVTVDNTTSEALSKKYGKDVIALRSNN